MMPPEALKGVSGADGAVPIRFVVFDMFESSMRILALPALCLLLLASCGAAVRTWSGGRFGLVLNLT